MDQLMYLLVIAAAMVFGWFIFQRNHPKDGGAAGGQARQPRRAAKPRPRKKR